MSQSQFAELMGFSYQQMQKYESGSSQVSVGRLIQFSRVLNVPVSYFIEGIKIEDTFGIGVTPDIIQNTRTHPLSILLVDELSADILAFKAALGMRHEELTLHVMQNPDLLLDYLRHYRDKYGKPRPDVILLEIGLDKHRGLMLVKTIKRIADFADIPIVVHTNSIRLKDVQESYAAGVAGFIQKNADPVEYRRSVEGLIQYWSKTTILPYM